VGSVAALLGLGIAVGTGAVSMPLSARNAAAKTTSAITAQKATASAAATTTWPGTSSYGYHVAKMPGSTASPATPRKVTAKPSVAATPTTIPSSPQVTPSWTPTATATSAPKPATSSSSATASGSGLTPQPTAENETPKGQNQLAWTKAILTALGDPLTSANIVSMGYWMQNEAGRPPSGIVGMNNPINVSAQGYGGTPIQYEAPGYSLMSYPTVADGVAATAAYLNSGSYPEILSDLKQGDGLSDPNLASEIEEYSGSGYSTIPDSWGQSQGTPLS
jgi:hypothetical protein